MQITVKPLEEKYLAQVIEIWNEVVEEGVAFPQEEYLEMESGRTFFEAQTYVGAAVGTTEQNQEEVYGMYILHPNNIGRCGHISNASFAVRSSSRGLHIGELLVKDCLSQAKKAGFSLMQFNAVVDCNVHARHLYERLGFQELGSIPAGFRMKDGHYEDIHVYIRQLEEV
ncbi:MAG: GNAT family N-acetyltransferase [Eubacteriales bacterium]|nr:GNAT family N-acetyltransferase [Eubacteriales bacterium]